MKLKVAVHIWLNIEMYHPLILKKDQEQESRATSKVEEESLDIEVCLKQIWQRCLCVTGGLSFS